jgi:hypothetical protein
MPSTATRLVIDDPENFHLLTTDMKEQIIQGGIATVNVQAALTRKNAVKNVQSDFTLRNNFTTSQIQFEQMEKVRFISLSNIESRVGITEKAAYMARQETGGVHKANGKRLAIPTNIARGGNKGSPVLKSKYLSRLKRAKGDTFLQRAAVAAKTGGVVAYNEKLFNITNFERRGGKVVFKMNMIYGLGYKETTTPAMPWLLPAAEQPAKDCENIFILQMKKLGM